MQMNINIIRGISSTILNGRVFTNNVSRRLDSIWLGAQVGHYISSNFHTGEVTLISNYRFGLFNHILSLLIPQSHGQVAHGVHGAHGAHLVIFIFTPRIRAGHASRLPRLQPHDALCPRRSPENYGHVQNCPPRSHQQSVPAVRAVHAGRSRPWLCLPR